MTYPAANVSPMPGASHWLRVALLHGPPATDLYLFTTSFIEEGRWLQLESYLPSVLCNSPGIANQPYLVRFFSFLGLFPLMSPCSSVIQDGGKTLLIQHHSSVCPVDRTET